MKMGLCEMANPIRRAFQLTYYDAEYDALVGNELVLLYERLRDQHPEWRFDFYHIGRSLCAEDEAAN